MENKTMEEVFKIAKIALENKLRFDFINKVSCYGSCTTSIEINKTMSPSQMYMEIEKKLRNQGVEVNEENFNNLKKYVEESK